MEVELTQTEAQDRMNVSLDFKLSKNYNSIGGQVGFASSRKDKETDEEFFNRVYSTTNSMIEKVYEDANKFLLNLVK